MRLCRSDEGDCPRAILDYYQRMITVEAGLLGLWASNGTIDVRLFDLDGLKEVDISQTATVKNELYSTVVGGEPLFDVRLPTSLEPGSHAIASHPSLMSNGELLIIGAYNRSPSLAVYAIYAFDFVTKQVSIFPQEWFTNAYDLGYQWITTVARHPDSGRFIGCGVRIGMFETTEDGINLERWLIEPDASPRYPW